MASPRKPLFMTYSYFENSCAFCQTHPYGYCALHCLLYVFGAARHMSRRWPVAISTLILRFPITCSFVFMSNLMAYNSMSNIFTPYNPVFLIPLKVKYKGEPPKTQWTLNFMFPTGEIKFSNWKHIFSQLGAFSRPTGNSSLAILSLYYFQYLYFVKVFYPNVETIARRWYGCNRLP